MYVSNIQLYLLTHQANHVMPQLQGIWTLHFIGEFSRVLCPGLGKPTKAQYLDPAKHLGHQCSCRPLSLLGLNMDLKLDLLWCGDSAFS